MLGTHILWVQVQNSAVDVKIYPCRSFHFRRAVLHVSSGEPGKRKPHERE